MMHTFQNFFINIGEKGVLEGLASEYAILRNMLKQLSEEVLTLRHSQ
jgi:hypothetical protein